MEQNENNKKSIGKMLLPYLLFFMLGLCCLFRLAYLFLVSNWEELTVDSYFRPYGRSQRASGTAFYYHSLGAGHSFMAIPFCVLLFFLPKEKDTIFPSQNQEGLPASLWLFQHFPCGSDYRRCLGRYFSWFLFKLPVSSLQVY